jgi:DNA repair protein RecO (recombination protein O)
MEKQITDCYVLHTRSYKETSLIISLFSKQCGRFSAIAKGVKRKNSQALRAILQPFNLLSIEFTGRPDLKTLCRAELITGQNRMANRTLACGYYLNELLLRSIGEWQDHSELFEAYKKSVTELQNQTDNIRLAVALRSFEVALLSDLGIAPDWLVDVDGHSIEANERYRILLEQGFQKIPMHDDWSFELVNEAHFKGQVLLDSAYGNYEVASLKPCQRLNQLLLRQVIGDKPLESRKLWST